MNLANYELQSNTQQGPMQVVSGVDTTAAEGRLVKMINTGGVAQVVLPTVVTDVPDYLILAGAAVGRFATVIALDRGGNCRVRLSGACTPGAELTHGAIDAANAGRVRAVPVAAGTYQVFMRAEETGVDGQMVRCRPLLNARAVVVP